MFEGQIKPVHLDQATESSVLRHLRWTDLVARLAATRDLRAELDRKGDSGFSAFSASGAETVDTTSKYERVVNHDASDDGKTGGHTQPRAANDAVQTRGQRHPG